MMADSPKTIITSPIIDIRDKIAKKNASESVKNAEPLKGGILPFHRDASGEIKFLIGSPRPQRNPNDIVPFGMARGARDYLNKP